MSEASKEEFHVEKANNEFSRKLYKILAEKEGNVMFSPISAHTVLSMAYQGARGTTAENLASALQVPDARSTSEGYEAVMKRFNDILDVTLLMANAIFLSEDGQLLEEFGEAIKKKFLSEVQFVNFEDNEAAAKTINEWVEKQTRKEIRDLIDKEMLNRQTKLVLVNAVYFKGAWKQPFDPRKTETEPFYISDEETVDVEMMHLTHRFPFKEDYYLHANIVQLPYGNGDISMVIVLPFVDINEVEEVLLGDYDLSELTADMFDDDVIVALPKFRIEQRVDLKESLTKLGLGEMFDEHLANFKGIMELEGNENLYVSQIVQKAFFEVDEEGAKGSAVSAGILEMFMSSPEMICNRPFIFLIKMKDTVIFMGKIVRP